MSKPIFDYIAPKGSHIWPFDSHMNSYSGMEPSSGSHAELVPSGKFGGSAAILEGTTNGIQNGNFATGNFTGWTPWGTGGARVIVQRNGTNYAKIELSARYTSYGIESTKNISVQPGDKVTVSFRLRGEKPNYAYLMFSVGGNINISSFIQYTDLPNGESIGEYTWTADRAADVGFLFGHKGIVDYDYSAPFRSNMNFIDKDGSETPPDTGAVYLFEGNGVAVVEGTTNLLHGKLNYDTSPPEPVPGHPDALVYYNYLFSGDVTMQIDPQTPAHSVQAWVYMAEDWNYSRAWEFRFLLNGEIVGNISADLSKKGQWQHVRGTFTGQADQVQLRSAGSGTSQRRWIALAQIEPKPFVTPYTEDTRAAGILPYHNLAPQLNQQQFTFTAWWRPYLELGDGLARIFQVDESTVIGRRIALRRENTTQNLNLLLPNAAGNDNQVFTFIPSAAYAANTWHFVAVVVDVENMTARIHLNDEYEEFTLPETPAMLDLKRFFLGCYGTTNQLNGELRDVNIFNKALSEQAVEDVFTAGPRTSEFTFAQLEKKPHRTPFTKSTRQNGNLPYPGIAEDFNQQTSTFVGWWKPYEFVPPGNDERLFHADTGDPEDGFIALKRLVGTQTLRLVIPDAAGTDAQEFDFTPREYAENAWHFIACVLDVPNMRARIFLDDEYKDCLLSEIPATLDLQRFFLGCLGAEGQLNGELDNVLYVPEAVPTSTVQKWRRLTRPFIPWREPSDRIIPTVAPAAITIDDLRRSFLGQVEVVEGDSDEIYRNVQTIINTPAGTVPFDRDFGIDWSLLDMPIAQAKARLTIEYIEKIRRYEPRAKVKEIDFVDDPLNGTIKPKVVIGIVSD